MKVVCSCSTWFKIFYFLSFFFTDHRLFCSSCNLSETEILSGWFEGDYDYQVPCTVCRKLTPVYLCFDRLRKSAAWHATVTLPSLKYGEQIYLLNPTHFREELEVQLDSRKGRIWKSKESFIKNQTTLFWNSVWYFSNLDLPFERAELNRVVMNFEETLNKGEPLS